MDASSASCAARCLACAGIPSSILSRTILRASLPLREVSGLSHARELERFDTCKFAMGRETARQFSVAQESPQLESGVLDRLLEVQSRCPLLPNSSIDSALHLLES